MLEFGVVINYVAMIYYVTYTCIVAFLFLYFTDPQASEYRGSPRRYNRRALSHGIRQARFAAKLLGHSSAYPNA